MPITPEDRARENIDKLLTDAGWIVQDKRSTNLSAGRGVTVREFPLKSGHGEADYLLFVDGAPIGVVEAKKEGDTLTGVELQTTKYSEGVPDNLTTPRRPLPFQYQSTGVETRFTNLLEPDARSRRVFSFHRPDTLDQWLTQELHRPGSTLRAKLRNLPDLMTEGLRPAQITAIRNLEKSLTADRPRALIQMASGGGKTFTACNFIYRLIKHAGARRILFLEARAMALHRRGGIYHYHFWVDGTRYRGSTKKANLAAARRVEALLLAQAEEKGDVVLRKRSPLLRDFKTRFFEWVEGNTTLKQKTKDYYENGWRLLEETDVAAMRLNAITKDDADRLTFPGGPSNHNNALRTLRRMLGKAEEWTIIKASPKIKLMQEHVRERVIDADIEAKLLPFCKQPLRDVLMIMRDSGMRNQKEVFRMRWEHLDWANKRYFVYESKSPKGRRFVPISPRVRQALLARYSEQKEGWIFPSKRARGGHLTTVAKQFEKARKETGLPNDLVLYCARHGFGTEMYRATKNLFAVMNVMGHTTVSTTMKYQHQNIDEVAEVASHRVQ